MKLFLKIFPMFIFSSSILTISLSAGGETDEAVARASTIKIRIAAIDGDSPRFSRPQHETAYRAA